MSRELVKRPARPITERRFPPSWRRALLLALGSAWLLRANGSQAALPFELRNVDPPEVGLSDATAVSPVGGNPGVTLGEQRRLALEHAMALWAQSLDSRLPVRIDVSFAPLERCAVGGGAQPTSYVEGEAGLDANLVYPVALAERIVERELNDGQADITATFNARLCDDAPSWYLGLDGQLPPDTVDLVTLAAHEFAHGLGLQSVVSPFTGELGFDGDKLDAYSYHVFDTAVGKPWRQMSPPELADSVGRIRALVWNGEHGVAAARERLAWGAPTLDVNPKPAGFSGWFAEASVGPYVTTAITARLRVPSDHSGCAPGADNGIESVLIVEAGGCGIDVKAEAAKAGGSLAVIAIAEFDDTPPDTLRVDGVASLAVPVLVVTPADGALLLQGGALEITLGSVPNQLVGADEQGRPFLHVAEPRVQGSNLSHWDPLARPSLLMEPRILPDMLPLDLSVERAVLADMGWTPFCGNGRLDEGEVCDATQTNDGGVSGPDSAVCASDCAGFGPVASGPLRDAGTEVTGIDAGVDMGAHDDAGNITHVLPIEAGVTTLFDAGTATSAQPSHDAGGVPEPSTAPTGGAQPLLDVEPEVGASGGDAGAKMNVGTRSDAGAESLQDGKGCSCRVGTTRQPGQAWMALLVLVGLARWRWAASSRRLCRVF